MRNLRTTVLIGATLLVAACTNATGTGGTNAVDLNAPGAAGSESDPTSVAYFQASIGDRVLFAVNQSTLSEAAKATLDAQAEWLNQNADYTAIIEGHADEQGTREYNVALGARRASAAREYLVSRGVAAGRLQIVSYGKERPIELCSDESCYSKNRRAVTVLAGALTG
jgi:peptidoglycan-associated lipoprotein